MILMILTNFVKMRYHQMLIKNYFVLFMLIFIFILTSDENKVSTVIRF